VAIRNTGEYMDKATQHIS